MTIQTGQKNDNNIVFIIFLCTCIFNKISYMSLLVAMSMDRFIAVYYPTRYNQSPKRIAIIALGTVTFNMVLSILPAFGTSFVENQVIMTSIVIIFIACSLSLVIAAYAAILYKVRQSKRKVGNMSQGNTKGVTDKDKIKEHNTASSAPMHSRNRADISASTSQ